MATKRTSIWRAIQSELEADIRGGLLAPGDQLPSENELAERFDVNRHTVRVALANLAIQGLVRARRGRGVFVEERPPEYPITKDSRWSDLEEALNATPTARIVARRLEKASSLIAGRLGLDVGAPLLLVETVRGANPSPTIYSYHLFDAARFAGIDEAVARTGSYTRALAEHGVATFFRASTWIDCRMPRPREAEALDIPADAPVLVMIYVDVDAAGRPILHGNSVIANGSLLLRVDTP